MKSYVILRRDLSIESSRRSFAMKQHDDKLGQFTLSVEPLSGSAVAELAADPNVARVAPAMPTKLIKPFETESAGDHSNWGIAAIGADRSPYTGAGVTVAILDTGIDRKHPAFDGMELVEKQLVAGFLQGSNLSASRVGIGSDALHARIG